MPLSFLLRFLFFKCGRFMLFWQKVAGQKGISRDQRRHHGACDHHRDQERVLPLGDDVVRNPYKAEIVPNVSPVDIIRV